jgi:drug/metabolite transporter (DMT)-like permease
MPSSGTLAVSTTVTVSTPTTASVRLNSTLSLAALVFAPALCCLGLKRRLRLQYVLLSTFAMTGLSLIAGCGGVSSPSNSTQPTTYAVTILATSGSLQHSTTLSVTVN